MHPLLWFVGGAIVGVVGATLFSNPIRKEIAVVTSIVRTDLTLIITRFHTVISRLEAVAHKLETKL